MAPRRGREVARGVLGVDAALDRVPAQDDVVLADRQRLAGRRADALLDDVDPRRHLGHAVLDLDAGVHLQEEVLAVLQEALDGAGAAVVDGARGLGGDLADALAQRLVDGGAGDSSMSFWWRRWTEQSRSPRWMTLPWLSARTWTSTWRGSGR